MSRDVDRGEVILELQRVSKSYRRREVLRDVDLRLSEGEVLGFVGPNGAGKTTLLKIVSGLARPSGGAGRVLGHSIGPDARPAPFLGIMLERPAFLEHRSGRHNLRLLASLRGQAEETDVVEALELVGLDPADKRPTRSYSLGMRQRLSFAQAVMERPRLLLLDEPTNGLDPTGIIDTRTLIRRLAREHGTAVLLASHMLSEVEAVCDSVMLVDRGRVRRTFAPAERGAGPLVLDLELARADQSVLVGRLPDLELISAEGPWLRVRCGARPASEVVRELVLAGVEVEGVTKVKERLEDVYLAMVGDERR